MFLLRRVLYSKNTVTLRFQQKTFQIQMGLLTELAESNPEMTSNSTGSDGQNQI